MSAYKERFVGLFKTKINRQGSIELLDWMETTDFFVAPASTRFHYAFREGLLRHSLNVYDVLTARVYSDGIEESEESMAIASLLHDLCKARFYKETTRNVKNETTGQWEKVPYYAIEDQFPFGHGEKSVYLIERFMRLKPAEAVAIRWHMGGFDDNAKVGGYTVADAFKKYPLATKLHLADLEATYLLENEQE